MKRFPSVILILSLLTALIVFPSSARENSINWVDFTVPASLLSEAADADITSHREGGTLSWIDLLAYLGQKYGGDFRNYRKNDLRAYVDAVSRGECPAPRNEKLYRYYLTAYGAILSGLLGVACVSRVGSDGTVGEATEYGVMGFYPIARGYSVAGSDDFGNARSFGYRRKHLGHDLFGSVGTPVIAVEGGFVEALGWNRYGGWRIGIRSLDGLRYYYYAHLRKDHPYAGSLSEGDYLPAGSVIGYLGMTGYSNRVNVNNIRTPHLHFGIQLIFRQEQKDGVNQIWINPYELLSFLRSYRAPVRKSADGQEAVSDIVKTDPGMPD